MGEGLSSMLFADKQSVFLVGLLRQAQFDSIVFGDEGQGYQLMNVEEFLSSSQVVLQLQDRVRDYLEEKNDFCYCNNDVE